ERYLPPLLPHIPTSITDVRFLGDYDSFAPESRRESAWVITTAFDPKRAS
ncbi:MAG: hypothetical protein ACI9NC_005439, partial [Verrucomicrobiales bacterium]